MEGAGLALGPPGTPKSLCQKRGRVWDQHDHGQVRAFVLSVEHKFYSLVEESMMVG